MSDKCAACEAIANEPGVFIAELARPNGEHEMDLADLRLACEEYLLHNPEGK